MKEKCIELAGRDLFNTNGSFLTLFFLVSFEPYSYFGLLEISGDSGKLGFIHVATDYELRYRGSLQMEHTS